MTKPSQLDRIEAKLDALLEALAEYEQDEPQDEAYDLDGFEVGGERDEMELL